MVKYGEYYFDMHQLILLNLSPKERHEVGRALSLLLSLKIVKIKQ